MVNWFVNLVVFDAVLDCVLDHGRINHVIFLGFPLQVLIVVVAFDRRQVGSRILSPSFRLHPSQLRTLADVGRQTLLFGGGVAGL